jgi:ParB family transcriptional regulator, chromosome partitioning protein
LGALLGGPPPQPRPAPAASPSGPGGGVTPASAPDEMVHRIPLDQVRPCPLQPRKEFGSEALRELADSIREQGIIQPLIVRKRDNFFELIAGERRWRAAQMLGLKEIPVLVRDADDRAVLEMALIENLQRENLNPIEEAQGFAELVEQFQMRQEDVAAKVGKSRAAVANALRLLKLSPELQVYVRDGRLSVGHAKVLLALELSTLQKLAAERILKSGLNVRQTEDLVVHLQKQSATSSTVKTRANLSSGDRDAHIVDMENRLQQRFGTKVQVRYRQGKGSLEIRFFNDDDLDRILQIVGVSLD